MKKSDLKHKFCLAGTTLIVLTAMTPFVHATDNFPTEANDSSTTEDGYNTLISKQVAYDDIIASVVNGMRDNSSSKKDWRTYWNTFSTISDSEEKFVPFTDFSDTDSVDSEENSMFFGEDVYSVSDIEDILKDSEGWYEFDDKESISSQELVLEDWEVDASSEFSWRDVLSPCVSSNDLNLNSDSNIIENKEKRIDNTPSGKNKQLQENKNRINKSQGLQNVKKNHTFSGFQRDILMNNTKNIAVLMNKQSQITGKFGSNLSHQMLSPERPYSQNISVTNVSNVSKDMITVYCLYNIKSQHYLYTTDKNEWMQLPRLSKDWVNTTLRFKQYRQGTKGSQGVYRLYNSTSRKHLYTTDVNEVQMLVTSEKWKNEGVAFYSPEIGWMEFYRFLNIKSGGHILTSSRREFESLIKKQREWKYEGIAWRSVEE
ncbi:hypothetical protein [Lactococcus garvieae]|uniref:hypothetical protein n=1 Tax=Lactococcus garvieae TaxID=1363 RepID=UPI0038527D6F